MGISLISKLVIVAHGTLAILIPTLTADSQGITQEAHATSGVGMEETTDLKAGGTTEMLMNVMMETRDQEMDAIQLAELREDGAALEVILE